MAAAAERSRLARELHDTVKQEIFAANLIAETLPKMGGARRAVAEAGLHELHEMTQSALAGMQALLLELRPGELDRSPLADALQKLGAAMSARAGTPIAVDVAGISDLKSHMPGEVKVAFYRVAQEALINAAKYAQAHAIRVRVRALSGNRIEMEVTDEGRGFERGLYWKGTTASS